MFKNSLALRIASALVALFIVGLLYHFFERTGLIILVVLAAIKAQLEYAALVIAEKPPSATRAAVIGVASLVSFSALLGPQAFVSTIGFGLVSLYSFFLIHFMRHDDLSVIRERMGIAGMGILYVGCLPGLIFLLLSLDKGDRWFATLLGVVFLGDVFAFFVGKALGRSKILPSVSPNKTWAGALGGLFGSALASVLAQFFLLREVPLLPFLFLALIAGVSAQIGDFFESLLKRISGKKDSGTIMPGHGGILDRIDGVLFAAPILYFGAYLFPLIFSIP